MQNNDSYFNYLKQCICIFSTSTEAIYLSSQFTNLRFLKSVSEQAKGDLRTEPTYVEALFKEVHFMTLILIKMREAKFDISNIIMTHSFPFSLSYFEMLRYLIIITY